MIPFVVDYFFQNNDVQRRYYAFSDVYTNDHSSSFVMNILDSAVVHFSKKGFVRIKRIILVFLMNKSNQLRKTLDRITHFSDTKMHLKPNFSHQLFRSLQ